MALARAAVAAQSPGPAWRVCPWVSLRTGGAVPVRESASENDCSQRYENGRFDCVGPSAWPDQITPRRGRGRLPGQCPRHVLDEVASILGARLTQRPAACMPYTGGPDDNYFCPSCQLPRYEGPAARACRIASSTPAVQGSPWPGSSMSAFIPAKLARDASACGVSAFSPDGMICGPTRPV